jgi:carbohydrate-binding DOMON domain-containing protein
MSTQYRLVQSEKTASDGCSAGQGSLEPVAPRIYLTTLTVLTDYNGCHFGKRHFENNSVPRPIQYIIFNIFFKEI